MNDTGYELLSKAIDLSCEGKHKEAWDMIRKADEKANRDNHIYNNLRDSVCMTLAWNKIASRKAVSKDE